MINVCQKQKRPPQQADQACHGGRFVSDMRFKSYTTQLKSVLMFAYQQVPFQLAPP